jgi:Skp family chaperone for outer membrane proteins
MIINVVDFEKLTAVYKPYKDGVEEVNKERQKFLEKLEPIRVEMQDLIKSFSTGQENVQEKEIRYSELQEQAYSLDEEFKQKAMEMKNSLNEKTFNELSAIINEFTENKEIDMVIGKMEVVSVKPEFEITDNIIELLKSKNLAD